MTPMTPDPEPQHGPGCPCAWCLDWRRDAPLRDDNSAPCLWCHGAGYIRVAVGSYFNARRGGPRERRFLFAPRDICPVCLGAAALRIKEPTP